jgi:citrate lyase subunit beta / citryl-CoA lyase
MQPMRSLIFVPADRENMVQRAHQIPADVIVLDMEDAVTPDKKALARAGIRAAIESLNAAGKTVYVRINHLDTGQARDDLAAAIGPGLQGILYPKAQGATHIRELDVLIREQEYHREGVRPGETALFPLIESARAVLRCEDIALASTRIAGLVLGGEDYTADLGVSRTAEGRELDHARRVLVHVCAAYKLVALDGIYADFRDEAGLRADAAYARSIGMKGKFVIHPDQVGPVNDVFSPTPAEIETARKVVTAFDEGVAQGLGTIQVDGKMIDAPVAKQARDLVAYAESIGIRA